MKRTAVFFFWDANGFVREYVLYFLEGLRMVCNEIIFVSNGELEDESHGKLGKYADTILIRKNEGFDVWAYKYALDSCNLFNRNDIEELILCNMTTYGPIFPFSEMFDVMAQRDCDFWGPLKHPEKNAYLLPQNQGYIHEHIMSHFIVVRKRMLLSNHFRQYWDNIPKIETKTESTAYHETVFTKHFEGLGYKSDSFVPLKKYANRENASLREPYRLLTEDRCPLVKRRAFAFPDFLYFSHFSSVQQSKKTLNFISKKTDYDESMIWEDVLATQKLSIFRPYMQEIQGISPHVSCQENWLEKRKISIIVYLQEYSAADKILSVANFLPKQINLVILCSQKDIKDYLEANSLKTSVLFCEVVPFTEMPFAALKYAKNMEESYDYICLELFYDETAHVTDITQELEEGKLAFISNLFDSSIYINNIIDYFERNSFLGVVEAVYPNFSAFFRKNAKLRRYIGNLYKEAYEYFNIKSPYNEQIATSMTLSLWIKKGCIDFSSILENKKIFLSAPKTLEYLLPMFVQEKRYYWGRVFNTENIANILTNNECQMNGLTNTISSKIGVVPEVYMSYISGLRQVGHTNDTTTCSYTKRQILFINLNYVKSKIKKVRDFVKLKLKSYVALEKQDTSIIDIPVDLKSVVLRGDILSIRILCNDKYSENLYLTDGKCSYYPDSKLSWGETLVANRYKNYNLDMKFFSIPIKDAIHKKFSIGNIMDTTFPNMAYKLRWYGGFSYDACSLKEHGLYLHIINEKLQIAKKGTFIKNILFSNAYSLKDKLVGLFLMVNPIHNTTIMAENLNAKDNTYELYKYAVKKNQNVFFVVSNAVRKKQTNPKIRRRMIAHDSKKHLLVLMFSKRWISSFSLNGELLPNRGLKDVHYLLLPTEWVLVPHGFAPGDKEVAIIHSINWGLPNRCLVCDSYEKKNWENYGYQNVEVTGFPRLDKWYRAKLNEDEIVVFFTWREQLHKVAKECFYQTDYFKYATNIVKKIRRNFPEKTIYYVIHHEIARRGFNHILYNELFHDNIEFVYLDNREDGPDFDSLFRSAKFLITDISSVVYDFSYKEGAVTISYAPSEFIHGHYVIKPLFYEITPSVIAQNENEVISALETNKVNEEILYRRSKVFDYMDDNNTRRVFESIFKR